MLFEGESDIGVLTALERTGLFVRRSWVQMNHDFGANETANMLGILKSLILFFITFHLLAYLCIKVGSHCIALASLELACSPG